MARTVLQLSILIALPALSWYAAMPLTAVTDITAIYNTFAFWAFLLAVHFLGEAPSRAKFASVVVAVLGVFVIAYGDSFMTSEPPEDGGQEESKTGSSRLIGNLLAFFGSVSYAWYEVSYRYLHNLPNHELTSSSRSRQVWYKMNGECRTFTAAAFSIFPPTLASISPSCLPRTPSYLL